MRSHSDGQADGLEEGIEEREGRDKSEEGGLPPRAPALHLTRSTCKSFTMDDRQSGSPMGLLFVLLFEPLSAALALGSGPGSGTGTSLSSSGGTRGRRTASELSSTSHGSNSSSSSSSSSKVEGGLSWRRVVKHRLSVFSSAKKWVIKLLTTASLLLGAVERRGSACTAAELRAVVLAFLRRHWIHFFCETGEIEKMASPPPYGADKRSSDTHRSNHQQSEGRFPDCDYSELREYALAAWRECGGGAHPAVTRPLAHSPLLFSSPSPAPHPLAPTSDHTQPHSGLPKSASRLEDEKGERSKQSRSILVVGLDRDLQEHLEGAGKRARQGRAILTGTGVDRLNINTQSQQTDEDGTEKVMRGDEEHDEAPLEVSAGVNEGQQAVDPVNLPSVMNIGQATEEFHNIGFEQDGAVDFEVEVEVQVEVEVESLEGVGQGVDVTVHESEPACSKEGIAIEMESVQVHEENSVVDLTSPITTAAVFESLSPVFEAAPVCATDAPLPLPLPPLSGSCEGSKCTVWEAESTGPGLSLGLSYTRPADLTTIPPLPATPETSVTKAALALACSPWDKEASPLHTLQLPVTASPPPLLPSSSSSSPPSHPVQDLNLESNVDFLVPSKPLPMDPPSQPLFQSQSARGSFPFTPPTSNMRRDAVSSTHSDADTSRTSPTLPASVDPSYRLSLSVPPSTARLEEQERPLVLVEPFQYLLPSQRELFSRSQNSAVRNSQELTRTGEAECGSVRGVITIGTDEVPLDDVEESKIEEISSQLVFLPHRASRNNNSSSSGIAHSSTLRVGRSFEAVPEGGRSKKRVLPGSQDHPRLSQEVEGYNVKRTLNGYIATADSVASSLMSVLNSTDGEGRHGSELKRMRNSVTDSIEMGMGIVVGGMAVAGDPVMRCSSPLTLIREALEANHRVNGRLLELSRRYQEDLVL